MSQKMYFRCYTCKASRVTKQSLVKRNGHLHCKECAKKIDELDAQASGFTSVYRQPISSLIVIEE